MNEKVVIRPVEKDERDAWASLWAGYLTFYNATVPAETSDITWIQFHDPSEPMFALGAYRDGVLTGIVHYLFHRSTWTPGNYCYLQDLFVAENARGLGLGRALIEAVYKKAIAAGASRVNWLTHESNAKARLPYDQVAEHPGLSSTARYSDDSFVRHCEKR